MNNQVVKVVPALVPYIYNAKLVKVVDGDTVHLEVSRAFEFTVDFGFHQQETITIVRSARETFRLARINAPEIAMQEGKDAKVALARFLEMGDMLARTYKQDKYNRWLVDLDVIVPAGVSNTLGLKPGTIFNVNDEMVRGGYAMPYMVNG